MFVFLRLISLILIVVGLMLLGADVVTSLESVSKGGAIVVRSIEMVWALFGDPNHFKAWCEHTLPEFLANWIEVALTFWGWAVTGVTGVVMAFLFGRRPVEHYQG